MKELHQNLMKTQIGLTDFTSPNAHEKTGSLEPREPWPPQAKR